MAQDDNKIKPELPGRSSDDRNSKKPPRFSIYWIYALIAVILIGYQFMLFNGPDSPSPSLQEFQRDMLAQGDVEKLELVKNKEVVRVYIKDDSLKKSFYQGKFKRNVSAAQTGPEFEFQVTDWESYNNSMAQFYKEHPDIEEVNATTTTEAEWLGPIAQTVLTVSG